MVYVLLAEGFEEIEALAPVDILRRGGVEVRTVGITGKTVCGSHGIPVIADILPSEVADDMEMLVFPGGLPGSDHLHASAESDRLIAMAKKKGAHIAAICAAPYLLGLRGLLEGKRATSYPDEKFRSRLLGADACDERVVTDGLITTGMGMGAAQEFGLRLLALLAGEETAERIAKGALIVGAEDACSCK
jgi:4-methyl-5(b-hydroxyethyl)-thiazole monophosphate biosynthesis